MNLSTKHLEMLRASAISENTIAARGYKTISDAEELATLGFSPSQRRPPGLLLPIHGTDGSNGSYLFRPDNPRVIEEKNKSKDADGTHPNKVLKYEFPKGAQMRLDCPPSCRPSLANPKITLWITEGQKKADALATVGLCAVALLGVWNFKGKNEFGGVTLLADFDHIALEGRDVRIVFDSDVMTKPEVRAALNRLTEHLQRKKAHVSVVYLPHMANGAKQGVDDFLAAGHPIEDLERFIDSPRPQLKPAAPTVELLESAPITMRRPVALVEGMGYAATWLYVKETFTEKLNRQQEVVRLDPPQAEKSQRLIIMRQDGRVFGDWGDALLSEIGFELSLPEIPPSNKLWSRAGVLRFRAGQRPQPADVFNRLTETVDLFIDFDRSLANQLTMCRLIACYILATWFLDAFNVIGYLYPNGDRGVGKTQLLLIVSELAYLGIVLLAGGSYAALRDLADYGATLAFDDAEGLSDPKKSDPDKRNLLLAGNRRGSVVTVKEYNGDKWQTRHVNAFCPRLFSAIRLPDPVLASRSIVVPLVRSTNRAKANADVLDYKLWRHDRTTLIDDLWALAVNHIAELPAHEARVGQDASLAGRNLEPWRAILAVASWLEARGVTGLWDEMNALSVAYQPERETLEYDDVAVWTVRALCQLANLANLANPHQTWQFETKQIAEIAAQFDENAPELPLDKDDKDGVREYRSYIKGLTRRIGMFLAKQRLTRVRRATPNEPRGWKIRIQDLKYLHVVYGLPLPTELQETDAPATPEVAIVGTVGKVGTDEIRSEEWDTQPSKMSRPVDLPCGNCGGTRFWQRPGDGGWVCAVCHPPLPNCRMIDFGGDVILRG